MKRTPSNHRSLFAVPLAAIAITVPMLLTSVLGSNTAGAAAPKASAAAITVTGTAALAVTDGPPWG